MSKELPYGFFKPFQFPKDGGQTQEKITEQSASYKNIHPRYFIVHQSPILNIGKNDLFM